MKGNTSMKRQTVSSSNLRAVGYDEKTRTLEVEFRNNRIYKYAGVPEIIFKSLMNASSHGKFLHAQIKDRFLATRIN